MQLEGAERAVAFVVPKPGAHIDVPAIGNICASRLAGYKVPARIIPLDAFPVTESANGVKIQRAQLRQLATQACTQSK